MEVWKFKGTQNGVNIEFLGYDALWSETERESGTYDSLHQNTISNSQTDLRKEVPYLSLLPKDKTTLFLAAKNG